MDDLWHVEVYRIKHTEPAHRYTALSTWDALRLVEEFLKDETVGGVVAYRPPLQTGPPPYTPGGSPAGTYAHMGRIHSGPDKEG